MAKGGRREGAGRPKGSLGKNKAALAELAQMHTEMAIAVLVAVAASGASEAARVSAASALLDRGHGKPHQTQEIAITDARAESLSDDELAGIIASRRSNGAVTAPDDPKVVH